MFAINAPTTAGRAGPDAAGGATLVSAAQPGVASRTWSGVARRPITGSASDAVPRISRAQSLDVLGSMANIAGYRAVIEAAHGFGRLFTGQVTAAGKVPPAKVLVVGRRRGGAGAIGCGGPARRGRAGHRPRAGGRPTRSRPWCGAYLAGASPRGRGQRRPATPRKWARTTREREAKLYAEQSADVDIVVTTALIPGRPAPRLITGGDGRRDEARLESSWTWPPPTAAT